MPKFLNISEIDTIVTKVMNDIPCRPKDEVIQEIQEKLVSLMTPECQAVYHTTPDALQKSSFYGVSTLSHYFVAGGLEDRAAPTWRIVTEIFKPYEALAEERRNMTSKLKEQFKSCRTLAALHEAYPDFAAYFPPITSAESARRKKRADLTTEELEALLAERRKKEEGKALKALQSFSTASELAQMGWTPATKKGEEA